MLLIELKLDEYVEGKRLVYSLWRLFHQTHSPAMIHRRITDTVLNSDLGYQDVARRALWKARMGKPFEECF
jgi:hypothetical protein